MAKWTCGWCGTPTHMTVFGEGLKVDLLTGGAEIRTAFSCDQCQQLSVAVARAAGSDRPNGTSNIHMQMFWSEREPLDWKPKWINGQDFPDVPDHIAAAAGEAHKSASIGNRMSAILMARTVIEATAKDKDILKGMLQSKIEAMLKEGLVRPHVKESADEIRHFGNDMAHGDINEPVDDDDVSEVLALMDEVLNEVYQSHARLAKVREKRLARTADGTK